MKEIQLTQGKVAFVDDDDFENLNKIKWSAAKSKHTFYAYNGRSGLKNGLIKMHHLVIGKPPKGKVTDHIDGNGLNNQKSNLRHVSLNVNTINTTNISKTSRFPGVFFFKKGSYWKSEIRINGKRKSLGYYKVEEDAFRAYRSAVFEATGELIEDRAREVNQCQE